MYTNRPPAARLVHVSVCELSHYEQFDDKSDVLRFSMFDWRMLVRFNVLECCSTDLRRHCHRCPLSRHSRIRHPWMLSPPFPCRQRRHKGHPFGSFIVRVSRNITDVRCGVIHAGCGIVPTSGSESFWDRPSWKPVWLQAVVVLFPSVFGGSCLASWIRLIVFLPSSSKQPVPFWRGCQAFCCMVGDMQLIFLIVARGYFSSPPLMRMKALCSFMSDVVKPYIEQTNDVTPGM